MAVAELFIGAFVNVLFEKLAKGDLIRLARSAGIYSELNKWRNTLTLIQAVLVDAGQKHIRDRSVNLWLNKLQHLAYEIDDVLDDLATEAMRSQLNQESSATGGNHTSKVLKFVPTKFHALKYGHKMSSKLDRITAGLRDLIKEKNLLGLNDNVERSCKPCRQWEETSLVHESKIIGREGDKEALLELLLDNESSSSQNVSVVSIVGLGGIGKTALAQLLYNDKKVKDHFELMAWVCVSDEFDVFNISRAIFQAVGGRNQDFANLNLLQVALADKLSNKRFLLVLDDVWNENYKKWELLQRPFTLGAPRSKILVTTRMTSVASVMDCIQAYPLQLLSDEEALYLFAQHASGKHNFDVNQTLKLHGEDIVKKCGRLPLALITLGRVFRTRSRYEEWDELLNGDIWNLDEGNEILPALRLSYYDLTPHLKQIFAYCCLFPKDYMFDKDEIVLLWMAEGFLYDSKDKSMEVFGRECFEELVSRSFFQHSTKDKSRYTMHDLISDLATNVAGEFFIMLDYKMHAYNSINDQALDKLHHLSFIHEQYGAYKKFKALKRARRLRTFIVMPVTRLHIWQEFYLSNKVLTEILPQLQFVRVLSLANYSIKEIPQSIDRLKHLRYLNFSNTKITCLPEKVGDLHNLQSLLLSGCAELSTLPNSIVKLTNLRHLDFTDTPKLNNMPLGFGGLTGLQTLSRVIIGGSGGFRISYLRNFLHLRGQVSIEGLDKVKNAVQAKEANLQHLKGLSDLQMEWSDVFDCSRNELTEYEVLEGLRPYEKLRNLKVLCYNGTKFPSWVGDPSFVCLTQITLSGCRSCARLPTLGHLPSLKKLFLKSIHKLKRVGSEFLGHSDSCSGNAFPSLEVLEFRNMLDWEEWSTSGGDKLFPCLLKISIINCPKLYVVAIELIPSLRVLHVEQCSVVVLRSMVILTSSISKLIICNIEGLTQLHEEILKHLRRVEYLDISDCDELTYLWESEEASCKILGKLQKLLVTGCANLLSFTEKDACSNISMESATEVRVGGCPRLKSYKCPNRIEKMVIGYCPLVTSLTFPTTDGLPSTLKFLEIKGFDNVEPTWLLNSFLSSLESLYIRSFDNLRLFPKGCLVYLTKLTISYCDNIESIPDTGYGFLPFLCLKRLQIYQCKNLKSFPHEHLQSLTCLEEIFIYDCPSMDESFPCGLWPPNLSFLSIGELKKPISEWGPQNFPASLVTLWLYGRNSRGISCAAKAEDNISSIIILSSIISNFSIYEWFYGVGITFRGPATPH